MRDWRWPQRTLTFEEDLPTNVSEHFASEDKADDRDYKGFLLFGWVGGIVYLAFFVLGVWKLAEVIGGIVG